MSMEEAIALFAQQNKDSDEEMEEQKNVDEFLEQLDDIEQDLKDQEEHISLQVDNKYANLVDGYMDKCDKLMGCVFRKKVMSHAEMSHYEARFKVNLENFIVKVAKLYPGIALTVTPMLKAITWQAVTLCRALMDTRRSLDAKSESRPTKKARKND